MIRYPLSLSLSRSNDAALPPPKPSSHKALFIQARKSDIAHWTSSFWLKTLNSAQVIALHTRKTFEGLMRSFSLFPGSLKSWFKKRKRTSGLHGLNKTYICMFCHLLHFSIMSMWDVFCTLLLFFKIYLFIYLLFLAALDLCFCARAFSSCGKRGPLFIAVRGPLTVAVSLVAEHRLQTRRLSSCGSRV